MRKLLTLFSLLVLGAVLAFIPTKGFSQSFTYSGKITNADGSGVPDISVQLRGTNLGTSTNNLGNFTIPGASKSSGTLEISGVGYAAQSIKATAGSPVSVTLQISNQNLQEVVVTALGFQVRRDKAATSQSSIKGSSVLESGEPSVLSGLASKASGVTVVKSGGDPGSSVYIQIRGQNTLGGSQPLFVVDGVPVSNTSAGNATNGVQQQSRLNDLNPEDIESVDVLKSAAAASLWGSRAANGVVIITTKKGKNSGGKINISLTTTVSTDKVNRTIPLQTTYGQGTGGLYTYGNRYSYGDKIADRTGGSDVFLTAGDYVVFPDGTKRYRTASGTTALPHGGKNSTDVFDHFNELFHTGTIVENTLSFSGGDDRSTFYASLSNLSQKGTFVAGSDYYKRGALINADRKFGKNVKLAGSINYTNVKSQRAQQGSNTSGTFLGAMRSAPDFDNRQYEGDYVNATGAIFPSREVSYRSPIGSSVNAGYDNPYWVLNRITSTSNVNRFVTNFEGTVDVTNWLQVVARAGVDYYLDHRVDNFPVIAVANQGGLLTIQDLEENQFSSSLITRANHSFSEDFKLSGLVGVNYSNRFSHNIGASVRSFTLPNAPFDLANSAGTSRTPFNSDGRRRSNSAFASANMEIYNQLFLELTGRYDAYSTTNVAQFYPSASLGWQFTKLGALANSNALSFGKLRLTYGKVGVEPGAYLFSNYYYPATDAESWGPGLDASSALYGGGYQRSTVQGNANIAPEIKTEYEGGLDLRFLKDRLSLSVTYYRNHTDGAILSVQVPATTGFTNTTANAAKLSNKGIEADLGVTWLKGKDYSITTTGVYSKNKNMVDDLAGSTSIFLNGFTGTSSRVVQGQPFGVLWGVDFQRDAKGTLVLDANGFPQSSGTEGVMGDPNPNWQGGLTNTFRYKNFSLSVLVDHVEGGAIWNGTRGALTTFGTAGATGVESVAPSSLKTYYGNTIASGTKFRGVVQNFGGGPVALNQEWWQDLGGGFGPVGSQFVEDGTRTRLREIALTYSINGQSFKNKTKLKSIDFSVTGRNLVLWTKYAGIDPETNLTGPSRGRGLDYFNNPSTRSLLFTVRINY